MKAACWIVLTLTLASIMVWAFTGVTWWVPTDKEPGRAMVIGWLHLIGIFGSVAYLTYPRTRL